MSVKVSLVGLRDFNAHVGNIPLIDMTNDLSHLIGVLLGSCEECTAQLRCFPFESFGVVCAVNLLQRSGQPERHLKRNNLHYCNRNVDRAEIQYVNAFNLLLIFLNQVKTL